MTQLYNTQGLKAALLGTTMVMGLSPMVAAPSYAQGIEEITVTAQRREQSLQDVGIAINAYTASELKALGIENSTEIALFTPGVFVSASGGGQNSQFTIRGVTQNDFNVALEGPIAAYFDEGYIPTLQGQIFATFDVDRVEILKGPQGTLFGRNATGGLVHYVPVKPGEDLNGYMEVGYGRFDRVEVEGAVGGRISETLSARVSVLYNERDGFLDNLYPQGGPTTASVGQPPRGDIGVDLGSEENIGVRGQILWEPNETWSARLTSSFAEQTGSTNPYNVEATTNVLDDQGRVINAVREPAGTPVLGILGQLFPDLLPGFTGFVPPTPESLQVSSDASTDDAFLNRVFDAALHLSYKGDGFEVVSITDFKQLDSKLLTDVEASPINFVNFFTEGDTQMLSQELRISGQSGKLSYTAGAYFLDTNTDVVNGFLAPAGSIFLPFAGFAPFLEPGLDLLNVFSLDTTSYSLFGQVEYEFNDQWNLVVGGRVIFEDQDYELLQGGFANVDDFAADTDTLLFQAPSTLEDAANAPNFSPFTDSRSTTLWVGKIQLEYRPNDDTLIYAGINRGAKGGAYNAPLLDGSPPLARAAVGYDPETLLSYEGGIKSQMLDGRLQVNAAVFYYDYNDYQTFTFTGVSGVVSNEDARTYGGEIDILANPIEGLLLGVNMSLFDTKLSNFAIAPGVFRDVEAAFAPERQISARASYEWPVEALGGSMRVGGTMSSNSSFFHNIRNFDAQKIDGFTIFNTRVSWTDEEERITISAFVNNLTDKRYFNTGFDLSGLCGCSEIAYGQPRQYGVEARYNF